MSVAIEVDNVIKRYGDLTIIPGLTEHIKNGEFFTLLGPSETSAATQEPSQEGFEVFSTWMGLEMTFLD